jgi:WD40 repeat protein/tetratricopeptide (TPR) repeat protein/tRNA A-37 threonylcarbamoyl transferase component Bud32
MNEPLTPGDESLSLSAECRVDAACLRFEAELKAGRRPDLADFLGATVGAERSALRRELIRLEVAYRQRGGEAPQAKEYLDRFHDLDSTWLQGALSPPSHEMETASDLGPSARPATPDAGDTADWAAGPADRCFGDYDVLEELGRGAFGVVYKARQVNLNRIVALKRILAGAHAGPADRALFRAEAQAAARLQHPNIAQVFEVGEYEGKPFFSLEFCGGGSLDKKLNGTPLPPKEAARLLETLARAVYAAHQNKIVHRDLKPANVLLAADGTPKITDFGLAKRLDEVGQSQSGAIKGTPSYMAPEQAEGKSKEIGPSADVYALGAILYECLTGRPPFKAATALDTLVQVVRDEPVPPRQLQSKTPRDLETICLKCLHKEPARRYSSAQELAEDMRRFEAGEPIKARPVSAAERVWRWCKRNPAPAAALATVLTTVTVAFGLVTYSRNQAVTLAGEKGELAEANGKLAVEKGELAEANGKLAVEKGELAERNAKLAEQEKVERFRSERRQALLALDLGRRACQEGRGPEGLLLLAQAQAIAPPDADDVRRAARAALAGWREHVPGLLAQLPHDDEVLAVAYSADGRFLATGCADRTARVWDAVTGQAVGKPLLHEGWDNVPSINPGERHGGVATVAFSPDGRTLATGPAPYFSGRALVRQTAGMPSRMGDIGLTDFPDLKWPRGGIGGLSSPALLAALWDLDTRQRKDPIPNNRQAIWALAYSPNGKLLASVEGSLILRDRLARPGLGLDGGPGGFGEREGSPSVGLYDVTTGRRVRQLSYPGPVLAVAFSPDGKRLLTGGLDGKWRVWDAEAKEKPLEQFEKPLLGFSADDLLQRRSGPVVAVAFSPDGTLAAAASAEDKGGLVHLLEANTGKQIGEPLRFEHPVHALAFSPDGRTLLLGCGDAAARQGQAILWDVKASRALGPPLSHPSAVQGVAFHPDGAAVATACSDGVARVWDVVPRPLLPRPVRRHEAVMALSANGKRVLIAAAGDKLRAAPASADGEAADIPEDNFPQAVLRPDGAQVLTFPTGIAPVPTARLWDAATGRPVGVPIPAIGDIRTAAVSPSGDRVLLTAEDRGQREARLWDPATGKPVGPAHPFKTPVYLAAFSPDGRRALLAGDDSTALLVDAETGQAVGERLAHRGPIRGALFSPDGATLATGGGDGVVRLWDANTGRRLQELVMRDTIRALAFNPRGDQLEVGSSDHTARVWDLAAGKPVGPALEHGDVVLAIAFSPDGRLLLTGCADRSARLWDASTGCPLGLPVVHPGPVTTVAFPDDARFLTRCAGTGQETPGVKQVSFIYIAGERLEREPPGAAFEWRLPPFPDGEAEQFTRWVEVSTGLSLDERGVIRELDIPDWEQRRSQLRDPGLGPFDWQQLDWHRREARAAAAAGQAFSVRWRLDRLLRAEPGDIDLYALRSDALAALGEAGPALRDAEEVVRSRPGNPAALAVRARAYAAGRRWKKAAEDYSAALEKRPDDMALLSGRGAARAELDLWDPAADDFRRASEQMGAPAEVWTSRALVAVARSDREDYRKACQALTLWAWSPFPKAVPAGPQASPPAAVPPDRAARLVWVFCVGEEGLPDYERACDLAGSAVRADPMNYAYLRSLGAALYRAGKYTEAVRQLEIAHSLRPEGSPSACLLLALAHQSGGRTKEAKDWLEKARTWRNQALQPGPDGGPSALERLPWGERLALDELQRQAEHALAGKAP